MITQKNKPLGSCWPANGIIEEVHFFFTIQPNYPYLCVLKKEGLIFFSYTSFEYIDKRGMNSSLFPSLGITTSQYFIRREDIIDVVRKITYLARLQLKTCT